MFRKNFILRFMLIVGVLLSLPLIAQIRHNHFDNIRLSYAAIDSATAQRVKKTIQLHHTRIKQVIGVTDTDTVTIWIASNLENFSHYAGGKQPDWAAAIYLPSRSRIVLKSPRWHDNFRQLEQELIHELVHHHVFHSLARDIPVWYHEGIAQWLSGKQLTLNDAAGLSLAMKTRRMVLLNEIDSVITFHRQRAQLAYAQSLSAVQFLAKQLGTDRHFTLFHNQIRLQGWDAAMHLVIGLSPEEFEVLWYRNLEENYGWFTLLGGDNLIWLLLVILFLVGGILVRWRNRRKLQRWQEEDLQQETHKEL